MIFNFGSGGENFNFSVKQFAQFPLIEAENTIGVITTTMTEWKMQSDEPQNPAAGLVWIKLGIASTTPLSISRTKTAMMYPIGAKEWDGFEWINRDAKCWQNGSWRNWYTYMYQGGEEFLDITGGWSKTYGYGNCTLTKYADRLSLVSGGGIGECGTANKVNFAPYSKLIVELSENTGFAIGALGDGAHWWDGGEGRVNDGPSYATIVEYTGGSTRVVLDVLSVMQSAYIKWATFNGKVATVTNIYFEV